MGLDATLENGVQLHWATPIFTRKFDDTEELNARLARIILEREQQDPGVPKSVVHGWHSKEDFFEWPNPEVAPVRDFVRRAMIELTSATTGHKEGEFGGEAEFIAWATILRRGGYNSVHTHPGCAWSGVYYVDTGGAAASGGGDGCIEFIDPRTAVEMVPLPGEPFGQRRRFEPEAGRMYAFPAWLRHGVTPYMGDDARISIAFNIRMKDFQVFGVGGKPA